MQTATTTRQHLQARWLSIVRRSVTYTLLAFLGFVLYLYCLEVPSFKELENPKSVVASDVLAADGSVLGRYFRENRVPVRYDELPKFLVDALVSTEDERFFDHSGIDLRAVGRSMSGVFSGHQKGGASTITQQLAKMLFARPELERYPIGIRQFMMFKIKVKEWITAVELERRYTKQEIIALYLNKFNFINNAYGIKTASETYFAKKPSDLTIEQAATLVGMLQNPAKYNPRRFPEASKARRNVVLKQMQKNGKINEKQYQDLAHKSMDMASFHVLDHKEGLAPYFREMLREEVKKLLKDVKRPDGKPYDLYGDGLKIYTTINPIVQKYAEDAVYDHFKTMQPLLFKHWASLDPWTYKQTGVDDAEVQQRLKILEMQIRNSERYQAIRDKTMPTATALELREVDIDRVLDIDKNGNRLIEKWLREKMISEDLAQKYRTASSTENIVKLKRELERTRDIAKKQFETPVKMKVFAYNKAMEKDTTMTPRDSVRYHRMHLQVGLMAVEPQTGFVQAWVGGPGFNTYQYDHVNPSSARQVGSTFKPYLYALSIEERAYSPCMRITDQRVVFPRGFMGLSQQWSPDNADGFTGASLTLYDALLYSKNSVSAYLMKDLGDTKPLRSFIARLGIDTSATRVPPNPSICLGACEMSVFEMTGAYTAFANDGVYSKPIFITKIEDKAGRVIYQATQEQNRVLSKDANYVMTKLLQYVAKGAPDFKDIKSAIGGKTGTTNYAADCWFMGITPRLVVGTWTGCDDRWIRFRDLTWGQGGKQARPIFSKLLHNLERDPLSGYVVVDSGFVRPNRELTIELDCNKYHQSSLPNIYKEEDQKVVVPDNLDRQHGDEFGQ